MERKRIWDGPLGRRRRRRASIDFEQENSGEQHYCTRQASEQGLSDETNWWSDLLFQNNMALTV